MDGEEITLVFTNKIVTRFEINKIARAFVTYLALFYLLDIDYPKSLETQLTIMQYIIYKDKKTPKDIIGQVDSNWKAYCAYNS